MFKKILYTQCTQPKEPLRESNFCIGVGVELITLSWMEQQQQRFNKEMQQLHEIKIKKLPKPLSAIDLVDEITPIQKLKQKALKENITQYNCMTAYTREREHSSKSSNAISDSDSDSRTWCYPCPRPIE